MADGTKAVRRADAHATKVAQAIIDQLKAGTAPWQKPWEPSGVRHSPYNASTGKDYRGGNSVYLWAVGQERGYSDPRWMTYKQAAALGGQVRRGEHGTPIEYWQREERKALKGPDGKPVLDENGNKQDLVTLLDRPRVFHATVFNAQQIDGLPPLQPRAIPHEWERHARAEAILQASGAKIEHAPRDEAYYRPSTDTITLPERGQFPTADAYYATALHELSHWTGHESRLNRGAGATFGSADYAKEELRAEIGSMMLGDRLGVGHSPDADGNGQHEAYVASWIKALQDDPREIFRAARDAERIQDFVMQFDHEHEQQHQQEHHDVAAGLEPAQTPQEPQEQAPAAGAARAQDDDYDMEMG